MWARRPRAASIPRTVLRLGSWASAPPEIHSTGSARIVSSPTSPGCSWKSGTGGWRRKCSAGSAGGSSTANASGVTPPACTPANDTSTPKSRSSCSATSPNGPSPTFVYSAARRPSRAAAMATLVGLPPTALSKLVASCQPAPT